MDRFTKTCVALIVSSAMYLAVTLTGVFGGAAHSATPAAASASAAPMYWICRKGTSSIGTRYMSVMFRYEAAGWYCTTANGGYWG